MGDELKQSIDRDRCFDKDRYDDCDCDRENESGWGEWLPILLIVFLLCGGTNIFGGFGGLGGFGGGGCRDECCDNNGFGGGWLLILILIFFLFQNNQGCGKDGGGFFGLF
ncbi:MAG: hypothetical protein K0R19_250 [Bacillota bacterium]|nr:hypothetical protein [Bacillota bacterium]